MSNPKLGNKHICKGCDTRFFDMKKSTAVCPKCGTEVKEAKPAKARKSAPEETVAPAAEAVTPVEAKKAAPPDGESTKSDSDEIDDELADLLPDDDTDADDDAIDDDEDDDKLIEDASDLSEVDDDLMEVREHIDDGSTDKG